MKKLFTVTLYTIYILGILLISAHYMMGQVNQVAVGAAYTDQVYYSLSTGNSTTISNESWEMAFSNYGQIDGAIFINEGTGSTQQQLELYTSYTTSWDEEIDTSQITNEARLYNPEQSWDEGALNSIKDPSNPSDYGWGAYNPQTHVIGGTKVFVLINRKGKAYKFMIESLQNNMYTVLIADINGQNEQTANIQKTLDSPLILFSLTNAEAIDSPKDYDLIFTRYVTPLDDGTGNFLDYSVTGVLIAPNAEGVKASGIDPETVSESDYSDQYTSVPSVIGYDWKGFDFSSGWFIEEDVAFFVRTEEGETYKIVFYDFEGSSTGIYTFLAESIGITSTSEEYIKVGLHLTQQ